MTLKLRCLHDALKWNAETGIYRHTAEASDMMVLEGFVGRNFQEKWKQESPKTCLLLLLLL